MQRFLTINAIIPETMKRHVSQFHKDTQKNTKTSGTKPKESKRIQKTWQVPLSSSLMTSMSIPATLFGASSIPWSQTSRRVRSSAPTRDVYGRSLGHHPGAEIQGPLRFRWLFQLSSNENKQGQLPLAILDRGTVTEQNGDYGAYYKNTRRATRRVTKRKTCARALK